MMSESREKVLDLRSVFGLKATVTIPSAATDGAYVEMDVTAGPSSGTLSPLPPRAGGDLPGPGGHAGGLPRRSVERGAGGGVPHGAAWGRTRVPERE